MERVPKVGYYDLKEQLIPALAQAGHAIRPVSLMPRHIRMGDLEGWLAAIRFMGGGVHPDAQVATDVRMEGTVCVLKQASIEPGASIRDSMIMEGACVESEAVVARSVVGPGMKIKKGNRIIDGILMNTYLESEDVDGIAPIATGTGRLSLVRTSRASTDEGNLK